VIYTKAYTEGITDEFDKYFDEVQPPLPIASRIPIYSRNERFGNIKARNLPLLSRKIVSLYFDAMSKVEELRCIIQSTVEYDMQTKWCNANRIIFTATLTAGGVGASPIPFSDTAALIAIQTGMIAGINFTYGLPISSSIVNTLVTALFGSGASLAGKEFVRLSLAALKAVPYLNIISSIICAGWAGSSTLTMGSVYCTAVDRTIRAHPELLWMDDLDKVEEAITTSIYSVASEKAKIDTKSLWQEVCQAQNSSGNISSKLPSECLCPLNPGEFPEFDLNESGEEKVANL